MSSPGSPSPGLPTQEPLSPEQQQQPWESLDSPEPMQPSPAPSVSVMPSLVDVGLQEWPNGWRYEGQFEGSLKHGHGIFQWASGEYYVGSFYKDHRHGHGIYVWPDGNKFTGMFYLDRKDGYGTLEMKDGAIFQGLYKADERFGPGVLTYPNGRQDVGLWYRNHLIRLCTEVPGNTTMKDHPLYYPSKEELTIPVRTYKEKYFWRVNPEEDPFFYPFKKLLFDDNYTLPADIAIYSTDADHLPLTRSYTKEGDRYFFQKEELGDEDETVKLPIVNQTPLLVQMQIHIYRHRHAEAMLSWDVAAVIAGNRKGFGPKGPLECSSEQLITAAGEGNQETVLKILKTNLVNADVADVNGHFSLIGAAAVCNDSIINLLLDNGANVNKLNNEGVSALNYSCIHYYPSGCFLHNEIYKVTNKKECLKLRLQLIDSELESLNQPDVALDMVTMNDNGIHQLPHLKPAPPPSATERKVEDMEMDDELTTQVKMAKRLSIYDRKIRVGSISFKKTSLVASQQEELTWREEEDAQVHELPYFEGSVDGETITSEIDEESLVSPSVGPPSIGYFESSRSVHHFQFNISGQQLQRAAHVLSRNQRFKSSAGKSMLTSDFKHDEKVWRIAAMKSEHQKRREIIILLLRRGADPNISTNPIPALFLAMLAGDLSSVKLLLESKADPNTRIQSQEIDGLTPLHVSVAIPGKQGVLITELLLNAAANPNEGAYDDKVIYEPDMDIQIEEPTGMILKSPNLMGVPSHYFTPTDIVPIEDGRTPLHIACQREDNHKDAHQIVRLLLLHKANPNLLWSGHSPLSLAIASGNDLAVNELLANGAEPNLPLTHGLGSAMCTAVNTRYEHKRSLTGRLALVHKLLEAKASILMPITLNSQVNQAVGTAVDYAYYKYFQDSRISQTPYHALTHNEREIYNARRELLNFLSNLFRKATITMERKRFEEIIQQNMQEYGKAAGEWGFQTKQQRCNVPTQWLPLPDSMTGPSGSEELLVYVVMYNCGTLYTATPTTQNREIDSALPPLTESEALSFANVSLTAKAIFERNAEGNLPILAASEKKSKVQDTAPRRQLFKFKFCYACGRSVGVRLITCSRCKEVYYCSKACKVTAWNEFHKDECHLTKGRPSSKKDGFYGDGGLRSGSSSPSVELDNYSYI
ncbi:ankyrin repeat and MYND domain-containing protein 1 [Hemiscyllium ocellatum]|uniref:ankyrin repeat and MYND domain-containing protein 1 n=1 Tax=Hemiscyllium ocellatum TaxID=170820 RepID=UPI0029677A79|nr:ankyrin repeat and MYND domain-containing protein 1 [Hemiscyllium ocellatum]